MSDSPPEIPVPPHVGLRDDVLPTVTAADGRALLAVAETDWSRPVPQCPGWDAAALVGHMGAILAWMATIVTTGQPVARADRERPPTELAQLCAWYRTHLDRTIDILTNTPPDAPAWTFSKLGDQHVGWWRRRLAVELAIHRWDAQHAAAPTDRNRAVESGTQALTAHAPQPIDTTVAAAGIEEFLTEFLPGLLAQHASDALAGTLHLHATDGPSEWFINLDSTGGAGPVAESGHRNADTAVRGTTSELLLWLTNRLPGHALDVIGSPDVTLEWGALRR